MRTMAKGDVRIGRTTDAKRAGVGKNGFIAIGRTEEKRQRFAGANLLAADLGVLPRGARRERSATSRFCIVTGGRRLYNWRHTPDNSAGSLRMKRPPVRRGGHMAEAGTHTFSDPERYAAAFGDVCVKLTITGAGNFSARLTHLKLQHLDAYLCRESLPRVAYISLPTERIVLSFPIGSAPPLFGRSALRTGDFVLHSRGDRMHQRSSSACQWGLVSLSLRQFANCGEAPSGHPIGFPHANRVLRPTRADALRFLRLFKKASRLAGSGRRPPVARSIEQEMFHAVAHWRAADEACDLVMTKQQHAAVMVRFEEVLTKHSDQKVNMATLCAEVGIAERTFRTCCAEVLGVSPMRYRLLQRLNRVRAALRRSTPSTASVAEIARDNQFLELGRFAVTYRKLFGESPSTTLQRDPQA